MTDPLLFLAAVLTLLGTPGPTNTLLATAGATAGVRRSLPLLLGELGGYLIAIGVVRLVLGPVIAAFPWVGAGLKIAVAIYLVWIAIALWRRGAAATVQARVTLQMVFVTTLLNPKAIIFALTVLPVSHPQLVWYVAAFALCVSAAGSAWIVLGRAIGAGAGRHAGLLPRVAAVVLGGFAGVLVASAFA